MSPKNNLPTSDKALDDDIVASAADAAKAFVDAPTPDKDTSKAITQSAFTPPQKPAENGEKTLPPKTQPLAAAQPITNTPQPVQPTPVQDKPVFATFDTQHAATTQKTPEGTHSAEPISYSQMTKNKKSFFIPIFIVVVLLLLGGAAAVFYFLYWTSADTVFSRFQKNIIAISNATVQENTTTATAYTYDLSVDANQNSENILSVKSSGRSGEGGADTSSDISYKGSDINVAGRLVIKDETSPYTLYVKLKGIESFLNSSGLSDAFSPETQTKLTQYDDSWVSINLLDYIKQDTTEKAESLTKENYQDLWKHIGPIYSKKIIGSHKDNGIFRFSQARSEEVAGLKAWAYDLTFDRIAFNEAVDEMVVAVDATGLSNAQKDDVKASLQALKEKEEESNTTSYEHIETTTIWLEKNTANIVRAKRSFESKYNGETLSKNTIDASITKFSLEKVDAEVKFSNGINADSLTEVTSHIIFDNSNKSISIDGNYGTKTDGYVYTLTVKPDTPGTLISKPDAAVDYKTIFESLNSGN